MKPNYRQEARRALKRARHEIECNDGQRLRYAALELRLAIEALTYDRAQAFKKELPPKEYETWQPRKLLQVLLEIYPEADNGVMLNMGFENESGGAWPMHHVGRETVFDLSAVKKHYDALGSYLHIPTLQQVEDCGILLEPQKLRARCNVIADLIENVLASPVYNVTLGTFSTFTCARCNNPVRRRTPHGQEIIEAECFECHAKYHVRHIDSDTAEWVPIGYKAPCPTKGCGTELFFWLDEYQPGVAFTCKRCGEAYILAMGTVEHKLNSSP